MSLVRFPVHNWIILCVRWLSSLALTGQHLLHSQSKDAVDANKVLGEVNQFADSNNVPELFKY